MHTTSRAEQSRVELGVQAVPCRRTAPFLLAPKNCNQADCGRVAWQSLLPSRNAISLGCKWVLHSLAYADVHPFRQPCLLQPPSIYVQIANRLYCIPHTHSHPQPHPRAASCELWAASCQVDAGNIAAGIFRCVILLLIPLAWAKIRYTAVGTFANHEKETKRASGRNTSAVRVTATAVPDAIDMLYAFVKLNIKYIIIYCIIIYHLHL